MKKLALLFVLSSISSAFAHVEPGLYVGKNPDGRECQMTALRQYFEENVPHPLNERIVIQVGNIPFTVGHPPVVDSPKVIVHFDHDFFQGVRAMNGGAMALIVRMNHEEGKEGPSAFVLLEHTWKADSRKKLECRDLKFVR